MRDVEPASHKQQPAPVAPALPPAVVVDAALVRGHQDSLWRYLRVLGADADDATDLAQEVFVVLLRTPLLDHGERALRGWLRTTARNLFLAHGRRRRRSPVALDGEALERAWVAYEGDDDGAGYRQALARCLETLPPRQRDLLARMAQDATADATTDPDHESQGADAIRSQVRRLKQSLRDCVQRRLRDER